MHAGGMCLFRVLLFNRLIAEENLACGEQAKDAAKRLKEFNIDRVIVSPFRRWDNLWPCLGGMHTWRRVSVDFGHGHFRLLTLPVVWCRAGHCRQLPLHVKGWAYPQKNGL